MKNSVEPEQAIWSTRDRLVEIAVLLAVATPALLAAALGEGASGLLGYERGAVIEGQFWRLISCHWAHLGCKHLIMNLATWLLIWLYADRSLNPGRWLAAILVPALTVGLVLLLAHPDTVWYLGLSGVLHGALVVVAMGRWRGGDAHGLIVLLLLALKLAWEQQVGPLPGSEALTGGPVLVSAHLYGALGGLLVALKPFPRP